MEWGKQPQRLQMLAFFCILALVLIGVLQHSFVLSSVPDTISAKPLSGIDRLDVHQLNSAERILNQRNTRITSTLNVNDSGSDSLHLGSYKVESSLQEERKQLESSWSAATMKNLSCSICDNLGVPFVDNFVPTVNMTCSQIIGQNAKELEERQCKDLNLEALCCDQSSLPAPYECEQNVRVEVLGNGYDATVAPVDKQTRTVEVDTFIEHLYLIDVVIAPGTVEIFAKVEMTWKDPRLAWQVNPDSNCVTNIDVRASHDPEKTDIWIPALDLVNKRKGIQEFSNTVATVWNDGTVRWQQRGPLQALCTFVGLRNMPFDTLGCQMHFQGHQKDYSNIVMFNLKEKIIRGETYKGFGIGNYQNSFGEFKIVTEKCSIDHYINDGSAFHIDLFFKRASRHYLYHILFPCLLFVIMSLGQFVLDISSGERLAFGVTIVLITVTQAVTTSSLLPLCDEMLWMNSVAWWSTIFTVLPLIGSLFGNMLIRFRHIQEKKGREVRFKDDENSDLSFHEQSADNKMSVNGNMGSNENSFVGSESFLKHEPIALDVDEGNNTVTEDTNGDSNQQRQKIQRQPTQYVTNADGFGTESFLKRDSEDEQEGNVNSFQNTEMNGERGSRNRRSIKELSSSVVRYASIALAWRPEDTVAAVDNVLCLVLVIGYFGIFLPVMFSTVGTRVWGDEIDSDGRYDKWMY